LVVTLRHFLKHKLTSAIKIIGLALGLAASLVVMIVNYSELTWDAFWPDADRLYLVESYNINQTNSSSTPHQLKRTIEENIAQISAVARLTRSILLINLPDNPSNATNTFQQSVTRADHTLVDIFSFNTLAGDLDVFQNHSNAAIISKTVAQKYFGAANPIGKTISIATSQLQGPNKQATNSETDTANLFKVVAVIEDTNLRSNEVFQVIIPYQDVADRYATDWNNLQVKTYVKLAAGVAPLAVDQKLAAIAEQNIVNNLNPAALAQFKLISIADVYLSGVDAYGNTRNIWMLYLLGLLIIAISLVNHINLTLSGYLQRQREIALRRLAGATNFKLFLLFWAESLVYLLGAFFIALMLVEPLMPKLADQLGLRLQVGLLQLNGLTGSVLLLLLISSLIIALYPCINFGNIKPARILHANQSKDSIKNIRLRKLLLTLQLVCASGLLVSVGLVAMQMQKLTEFRPGYNIDQIVFVHGQQLMSANIGQLNQFKSRLEAVPEIKAVARMTPNLLGMNAQVEKVSRADQPPENSRFISTLHVPDYNVFNLLQIPLIAGELPATGDSFLINGGKMPPAAITPSRNIILCNNALHLFGFASAEAAVGQQLLLFRGGRAIPFNIAGITGYLHVGDLNGGPKPCLFQQTQFGNAMSWGIRHDTNKIQPLLDQISTIWAEVFSGTPYSWQLKETVANYHKHQQLLANFIYAFTGIALLISLLGIYGLAGLNAQKRAREIALRKLHGASAWQIILLLTREFSLLVIIANVIAWPITIYAISRWLENFYNKIDMWLWAPFFCVLAGVIAFTITWLTVSGQALAVAMSKPADSLREE
ncbi:MAG TPA: ABC transporter permease, partial [Cellvibrio sp.]|nr:ABC transporter permease [Cellvibrio sp.]